MPHLSDAAQACLSSLDSHDRFEYLQTLVGALPATIDRDLAYQAIADALATKRGFAFIDPLWTRDVASILDAIEKGITRLRRVIEQRDGAAVADVWTKGLEKELVRIKGEGNSMTYLTATRVRLGWVKPSAGRPKAEWRTQADSALKKLGVQQQDRTAILDAAGLSEPYRQRSASTSTK